jgi:hypothetical protein
MKQLEYLHGVLTSHALVSYAAGALRPLRVRTINSLHLTFVVNRTYMSNVFAFRVQPDVVVWNFSYSYNCRDDNELLLTIPNEPVFLQLPVVPVVCDHISNKMVNQLVHASTN